MKKTIEIKRKIDFSNMIGEVSAISLENHLYFVDSSSIRGNLTVLGRYKSTAASRLEEDFQHDIPVEITLTSEVDSETGKIQVSNFYYDIVEGKSLLCHIEIEIGADEIILEERECDGDPVEEKEIEIPHIEEEEVQERVEDESLVEDLEDGGTPLEGTFDDGVSLNEDEYLFNIDTTQESFGTFIVYMVRQNETINSIIEKYQTSIEEIEKYNDIKDLSIGSKIIIPISNEKDS